VFITHRASSGAALARGLAEVLAVPPGDPFAAEVVAVPAKGVERWRAQRLSHVLGTDDGELPASDREHLIDDYAQACERLRACS
jgi:exodeoxyribonuclease V gamma subunit